MDFLEKQVVMKYNSIYFLRCFVVMATGLCIAACQQDEMTERGADTNKKIMLTIEATHAKSCAETRTVYTPTDESDGGISMALAWKGNEQIGVVTYENDVPRADVETLTAVDGTLSCNGATQKFSGEITASVGNDRYFYLCPKPKASQVTYKPSAKDGYVLQATYPLTGQVQDCTSGKETDHLFAYDVSYTNVISPTAFQHYLALFYADLTLPEDKSISEVRLVASENVFAKDCIIQYRNQYSSIAASVTNYGTKIVLTLQNDVADNGVKAYMMVPSVCINTNSDLGVPADVSSFTFHVEAVAEDNTVYSGSTYSIDPATSGVNYVYLFKAGETKTLRETLIKK